MGKAMLDPRRDLAGATPEMLARALFRPLRPRARAEAVEQPERPAQKEPARSNESVAPGQSEG